MVTIITERLRLREFDQEDWVSVYKYASDPEVVRYLSWGPNSREDTKNFNASDSVPTRATAKEF